MMRNAKKISGLLAGALIAGAGVNLAYAASKPAPLAPLGKPSIPADNKPSAAKLKLGKLLFWDPRLGGDGSTGCVTCHLPEQGWGVSDTISLGYPGTVHWRNSHTVVNSAYLDKLFWVGASASLEKQAKSAATGAVAGNGESDVMEARLAFIPEYRKLFKEAFGTEWPVINDAWKAIAAFERTLIHNDTPIDRYLKGDKKALTKQQKRGMKLFNGKANCIACHNGALATDQKYYNLGLPPVKRWEEDGLAQVTFRYEQYSKGVTQKLYRKIKDDAGLYYRTKQKVDMGKFRTAPLRYIKYTAPYMHNGSLETLKDVVEFYNRGGGSNDFTDGKLGKNKTPLLKPLGLSKKQVADLVAFLDAFSGKELTMEEPDLPDYAPLPNPAKK